MRSKLLSDEIAFHDMRLTRRGFSLGLLAGIGASLTPALAAEKYVESGTVTIEQVQIAFIGSGNLGGGTLLFGGKKYDFTVGGLGFGGYGVSKMEATGTVYNLRSAADFSGAYVQARYGLAVGELSTGSLWLENARGVALNLKAKRTGLALSLGADAIYFNLS